MRQHTYTHTCMHEHTYTHVHVLTHVYTHACAKSPHTSMRKQTHIYTRAPQVHTSTPTCTHKQAQAHTYTLAIKHKHTLLNKEVKDSYTQFNTQAEVLQNTHTHTHTHTHRIHPHNGTFTQAHIHTHTFSPSVLGELCLFFSECVIYSLTHLLHTSPLFLKFGARGTLVSC